MPGLIHTRKWRKAAERSGWYAPRFATLVLYHQRTLQRLFRKELNCTVSQWLNQVRLVRAKVLARQRVPATQIARILRFKSLPTFSREFKKAHGITVSGFQRELKLRRKRARRSASSRR